MELYNTFVNLEEILQDIVANADQTSITVNDLSYILDPDTAVINAVPECPHGYETDDMFCSK